MTIADGLVSQVVLGEHELVALSREDDAVAVFRSRSTVDGGVYTVVLPKRVGVTSGATEIAGAATRASRQAVGISGVLPLLAARTDQGHVWTIRRGEPGTSLADDIGAPHTFAEVHALLAAAVTALGRLHDIGQFHGALSPLAFVTLDDRRLLDFVGLSTVAEASGGRRGLVDVLPTAFRPPELAGEVPSSVGPWSDVHVVARIVVALLGGSARPRDDVDGLTLPAPLAAALTAALASAPARRPTHLEGLMSALLAGGKATAVAPAEEGDGTVADGEAGEASSVAGSIALGGPTPLRDADSSAAADGGSPLAALGVPPAPPTNVVPSPPESMEKSKTRDALGLLVGLSAAVAALLFLGGAVTAAFLLFRPVSTPSVAPAATPTATVVSPVLPPPAGTEAVPESGPADPADPLNKAPVTVFAPRPAGEVTTNKEDEDALLPLSADDPVRGNRLAPATLVVFADLTCPFSRRVLASLPGLEASLGGALRVAVKVYPLPGRPGADDVAEAALAVRKRGGNQAFFAFISATARGPSRTDAGSLEEMAIKAGAPAGAVTEALRTHSERARLETNVQLGRRLAVLATPVLFVNGRRFDGLTSPTDLEREIKLEAGRAQAAGSTQLSPESIYKARVLSNITTAEADGPRR